MENRISERLTLARLASSANLSPSRLRHLFKQETGTTPTRYLKEMRLVQAEILLRTTFLTVKEISNAVGLTPGSHLVRAFKKTYGTVPTTYREVSRSKTNRRPK